MIDLERYQDPLTIQRVLHSTRTIAIVGLSGNELRASHFVGYYLKRHGYRVIPVNPRETEILGETSYPSLLDVPVPVDLVDVFRAPDALPAIARDLDTDVTGLQWTIDAYLVTLTAFLLLGGALGDTFGRRRVFSIGLGAFTVASVLCAAAPNVTTLAVFRAFQGG